MDISDPIEPIVISDRTSAEEPIGNTLQSSTAVAIRNGDKTCLHDVAFPPGAQQLSVADAVAATVLPVDPARKYKFELDPFQKQAVSCIEKGESVLVSAHTSAGKTVVAEYAIALSLKHHQRVIYTSPIKALSNQKYRDLYEEFADVGLMTGDVTINPGASCLVMTTEILRSMLYRGSEIMREVAWVIFDEIHYMRDKERGVVWEETIILLPDKVHFVFLSATIPNAKEFASWIAKLHKQPCHVIYTDYRPTPLQHYIFPAGGEGLHLVVDEKGVFREDNFQKALSALVAAPQGDAKRKAPQRGKKGPGSDCYRIVKMIMERNYDPVIIFSFSKREVEAMATSMSKLDFNSDSEKKLVDSVFSNAIDSLSDDDKTLPQVESILPLLKRGIGIHHSGLLPIIKEVIEILFQEGLIKALFATETFSMGLNMPAKTVVFTNVRKFDGEGFRWVTGGEYIQMSGRAGRRGLDDRGIVILMVDEKMEPAVAKNMVKGGADPLNSTFHLGYNMVLNLLRVDEVDPEYLMSRSFHQFQNDRQLPEMESRAKRVEAERNSLTITDESAVADYYDMKVQLERLRQKVRQVTTNPIHALPYMQPGRLVKVTDQGTNWGWGVVVNFQKREATESGATASYVIDVLLECAPADDRSSKPRPCPDGAKAEMNVIPVLLPLLESIGSVRVYMPKDLRSAESRQSVLKSVTAVKQRFPDGIPVLDPIEDMHITDDEFGKLVRKIESMEQRLFSSKFAQAADRDARYAMYARKLELDAQLKSLRRELRHSESTVLLEELKRMKRVLRRLGYTNSDNVIETKGRVACEINTADELIITELMFNGVFNEMSPEAVAALLSAVVFQEKAKEAPKVRDELSKALRQMQEAAKRIAKVSQESKIPLDTEEYLSGIKPALMELVFAWASGAKFGEICKMTDVFEGSLIRMFRRLEELLRQLGSAAKSIGNSDLENKFAISITKIKRDIVFAASLYL
eukprot:TRINITY_DN14051_c0_g1_i1.p1 TRINITY_DN14051_c0_g1~~TRINITY_DN14051_c0_g1_i1.p1  ORF type:complete len:1036 (-),score=267.67 TRINITY_DN14051_c0_g1_i1:35-2956(-)